MVVKFASVLKARLEEAKKSGKRIVFLGGDCSDDNVWRETVKKEFGDKLAFIDPYDEGWDPEDNIYDELASLVSADHIVFYRGGKGTKKEKEFLEASGEAGEKGWGEFDNLSDLRKHLKRLSKPANGKEAKEEGVYKHATTQVDLPDDLRDEIIAWGNSKIPDADLVEDEKNSMGREDEIHVTVLFGVKDSTPESVAKVAKAVAPFDVRLGLVTLFKDKKEYDVVKLDVEAPELHRLHYEIKEAVPCEDSFPTYVPHVTVAYVKKGAADKVLGSDKFRGRTFKAGHLTFKSADKDSTEIPFEGSRK